jgi:outer membrane protein OmpA-like peptidoglycan-associated protein
MAGPRHHFKLTRARSTAGFLVARRVPASIITVSGLGDVQSVRPTQGRAKNRRVVVDIVAAK